MKFLEPVFSKQQSFYNKAYVKLEPMTMTYTLESYNTPVIKFKDRRIIWITENDNHLTQTTMKHIREFLKQNSMYPLTKSDLIELRENL